MAPRPRRAGARSSGSSCAIALLVAALGIVAAPRHAWSAEARAEPARVVIEVAREEGTPRELEDAVVRAVVRIGGEIDLVRVEQGPRLGGERFARVTVRSSGDAVVLELVLADGTRSTRRIARSSSSAVLGEEVSLVVESALESAIDATLERRPKPPPPAPPPPPARNPEVASPQPLRAAPPPASLVLFGGAFAGTGAFGSGASPVARLGGEVGLASTGRFRPSIALRVSYTFPFAAGDDRARVDTSVVGLRAMPAAHLVDLSVVSLGLGLGVGVDVMSVTGRSDVPGARAEPLSARPDPIVSPTLLLRVPFTRSVALAGSFAVDFGFASRSWMAAQEGARFEIFTPFRARPVGLLGLEIALWSEDSRVAPTEAGTRGAP